MKAIEIIARESLMDLAQFFPEMEARDMIETAKIGTMDEVRTAIYAAEARMEANNGI